MARDVAAHYDRLACRYDRRWRRYVRQTLERALDALHVSGSERVLDVGCGTGEFERMALARFPHLTLVGVDLAGGMIAIARRKLAGMSRVSFQVAHAEQLPFGHGTFDVVVCANALHHMRRPRQLLQECARVLRAGGQLILVDWCRDFWHCRLMHAWLRLVDRTYVRMYRLAEGITMLEEAGYLITSARRFLAKPCYGMWWSLANKRQG